jgi:hypothetical protein
MLDANDFIIFLGGGIGFVLAAALNDALRVRARRRAHQAQPKPITEDQRIRTRTRGTRLIVLGVLIVPAVLVAVAWLQQTTKTSDTSVTAGAILGGVVTCGICIASGLLVTRGRRTRVPDATTTLATDARPPIVYLRTFDFDRSRRQAVARSEMFKRTYEERLARALRSIGPFVALGDPSDELPELGAVRLYPDNADWQQAAMNLTGTAGTIVLHVGDSPSLAWEVEHVVGLGQPERMILSLATGLDGAEGIIVSALEGTKRYDTFRDKLGHWFPQGLPADIGSSRFLYFEADWTPRAYVRSDLRHLYARSSDAGRQRTLVLGQLGRLERTPR